MGIFIDHAHRYSDIMRHAGVYFSSFHKSTWNFQIKKEATQKVDKCAYSPPGRYPKLLHINRYSYVVRFVPSNMMRG